MNKKDLLREPVIHMKIDKELTVDDLMRQFGNSGSFGAGRLATACNIYEKMARDEECTVYLALAGAVVPAGLRSVIAHLIRERLVNVVVSTGANMIHDAIEAVGGHHYKGHWIVDDHMLYNHNIYRIYDIFVQEEDFLQLDHRLVDIYGEIADQNKGKGISSTEFTREVGKRIDDPNSILRAAYESNVPIFLPALRDSEFGYAYWLHALKRDFRDLLVVDAFKDVPEILGMFRSSIRNGMIVIGGGVPRNTVQSAALATRKGMDYAILITMDRPETGGLSGSTLEESVSWGKVKGEADKVMIVGDATMVFPMIVASVIERLGKDFKRETNLKISVPDLPRKKAR